MAKLLDIVEGWTGELGPFTLKVDGVIFDLTGMTVELKLRPDGRNTYTTTTGDTRVDADPTTGNVYYKPDADDFLTRNSPYLMHWKVTDGAGSVIFFPNSDADTVAVYQP